MTYKRPGRGRPARDGEPIGGYVASTLAQLALQTGGAQYPTKTSRYEAIIARGLDVEAEIGPLPAVSIPGDKTLVKLLVPSALWPKFDDHPGMSRTDRIASLLFHGLGLHLVKDHELLMLAG